MNPRKFFEKFVKRIQRTGESLSQASKRIMDEVEAGNRRAPRVEKRVGQYTTSTSAGRLRIAARKRIKASRMEQRRKGIYRKPLA